MIDVPGRGDDPHRDANTFVSAPPSDTATTLM
jgi:hypothetical protein